MQPLPSPNCTLLLATLKDGTVLGAGGVDFVQGGTGHRLKVSMQFSLHG
jgi:hypothetical protein